MFKIIFWFNIDFTNGILQDVTVGDIYGILHLFVIVYAMISWSKKEQQNHISCLL
jgi:hypothetical protein